MGHVKRQRARDSAPYDEARRANPEMRNSRSLPLPARAQPDNAALESPSWIAQETQGAHQFADVRVHANTAADRLSRELDARALLCRLNGGDNTSGQPLDVTVRTPMERRFGHDFADVRVHTDGLSAMSAEVLHSRAYTIGNHLVFGAGRYAPASKEGERLIAHELTHVMQRDRAWSASSKAAVSQNNDPAEVEARIAAENVVTGNPVNVSAAPAAIARDGDDDESFWKSFVQGASGLGYGAVQGFAPGGFLAPSPDPHSRTFEFWRGVGQLGAGLTETLVGAGGEALGFGLDATGVGAVAGVPINVGSAVLAANGVTSAVSGIGTIANAMSMGDDYDDDRGGGRFGGGRRSGGKKQDIAQIESVAKEFKMTPEQRRDFGDYVEMQKASARFGSKNERGDFTYEELRGLAKEFLGD
jgi:uncharacterized protein DUF4157